MPATAQVRIAADTKQFKRAMDDVNDRIGTLGKISRGIGASLRGALSFTGNAAGLTILGGVPAVLGASAKAFSKFEKNMMEVYTLLPHANRAFFEEMKRDALSFSEEFGIMPEEVSRGMYQAISSGVAPEGLDEGFLKIAQEAAIAGVTDLKTSVDALTNVVNSYGDGVYDMQYVSDLMFKSVAMSKTTFRELADYMYQILPTAGSLGLRLDDLFGSISALASTGTLTRVGTTQLRQFLIEISRTGDKANMAFLQASRGKPFEEYIKEGGRLVDVVKMLGDYAKSRQISMRNLFGSVEAGNAALTLAKSTNFVGMVEALEDPSGAQAQATAKMMDTLGFRFARITRTSMNNFIKLGEVLKPVFKDILDYMEKGMQKMRDFKWESLGQRFQQEWAFIKKLIRDDKIFGYMLAQMKVGFAKAAKFIIQTLQQVFDSMANMISIDASSVTGLGSALGDIAVAFTDRILLGFAKIAPMLISSLAPFVAFFSASIERIKENLTPDTKSDMKGVRQAQTQAFKKGHGSLQEMLSKDPDALAKAQSKVEDLYTEHGDKILSSFRSFEGMEADLGTSLFGSAREIVAGIKGQKINMVNPEEQAVKGSLRDVLKNINDLNSGSLRFILKYHGFQNQKELFDSRGLAKGFGGLFAHLDRFIAGRQEKVDAHKAKGERGSEVLQKSMEIAHAKKLKQSLQDLENYFERVVNISDQHLGKSPKIDKGEIKFNEVYKRDKTRLESFANEIQGALDESYAEDVKNSNAKIKEAVKSAMEKVKGLEVELAELELAPVRDSLAINDLNDKIDAFNAEIKAYEFDKQPITDFAPEEPKNEGKSFETNKPILDEYEVRGFMPSVTADSKTKIGAGGGFYGFDPEDQLIDSNLALKNSLDALNSTISNFTEIPDQIALGGVQALDASYGAAFKPQIGPIENVKSFIGMLNDLKLDEIKKSFQKKGDPEEQSNQMRGFIAEWNKLVPSAPISESVATEYDEINFKRSMNEFKTQGGSIATALLETIRIMKTAKPVYDEKGKLIEDDAALIKKINSELKGGFNNYNEFLDFITKISKTSSADGKIDPNFREKVDQRAITQPEKFKELNVMEGLLSTYNKGSRELELPDLKKMPMLNNANRRVAGTEDRSGVFRQIPSRIKTEEVFTEATSSSASIEEIATGEIPKVLSEINKKIQPVNRVFGGDKNEPPKIPKGSPYHEDYNEKIDPILPEIPEGSPYHEDFNEKIDPIIPEIPEGSPFHADFNEKIDPIIPEIPKGSPFHEDFNEKIDTDNGKQDKHQMPAEVLKAFNQGIAEPLFRLSSASKEMTPMVGGQKAGQWTPVNEADSQKQEEEQKMPAEVLKAFNQGVARPLYSLKPATEKAAPMLNGQKAGRWEIVSSNVNNHLMSGATAQAKASADLMQSAQMLKQSIKEKNMDSQPVIEPINF